MEKVYAFDMDGTLCDFYGVDGWLDHLKRFSPTPYEIAKPLINLSLFARLVHRIQKQGDRVIIISWLSKTSNTAFDQKVTKAKFEWLAKHLPSVLFDEIYILPHGTPKSSVITNEAILFDDEEANLKEWIKSGKGTAYPPSAIFEILKNNA